MRSSSLVLLLALTGTALSGCASGFEQAYTQSSIPGGSGGTSTDTGGDGISGDTGGTGDPNGSTLAGGDTAIAYVDGARSTDGSGNAQLIISSTGSTATVSVDPGLPMGFSGTTSMAQYISQAPADTHPSGLPAYTFDNANYVEYRRITATSDNELQVWNFTDGAGQTNYAAHFRNATAGHDAWFHGGSNNTDSAEIDALTASNTTVNYTGNYAGVASTTGWGEAGTYQSADGEWRFNGTATMAANFGSGTFSGTLTPRYWEKFENGALVQIDVGADPDQVIMANDAGVVSSVDAVFGDIRSFHTATVELSGTIAGSQVSGDANLNSATPGDLTNNGFVNGDRALQAGFYGTNAEQVTGVFATYGVMPSPNGGDTGINDDQRGTVDMQGVFHGQ